MFHLFRRTPDSEASPEATPTQARTRRLVWVVATLLGGVLVVAMALFPLQVAAAPSSAAGALSSSTNPPLLKIVPRHSIDPDHNNFYCKVISPSLSICHVTLTEKINSSRPLHWFSRTDPSLTAHPSSGNLSPGRSVEVKIDVNQKICQLGSGSPSVFFIGPKNVVSVLVFCD